MIGMAFLLAVAGCGSYTPIRTHFNKGHYLYTSGNFEGAVHEYRAALDDDATDSRARFNLAVALEKLGRRDDARHEYEQILALKPDDMRASVNLAAMELEDGHVAEGRGRLERMVKLYDTVPLPRVALATHEFRAGNDDVAERLVREGLERDSADVEANFILGEILSKRAHAAPRGEARDKLVAEARKAYDRGLHTDPEDLATLTASGRLEQFAGEADAAIGAYRRVLYIDRRNRESHMALAELLESQGDDEGAVYHLWEAARSGGGEALSTSADHAERLAKLYERLAAKERNRLPELRSMPKP